jgi:hypothetical protein
LLSYLGIILRVLIFEVSVYNDYITSQFQKTVAQGGGGGGLNQLVEVAVNSKEENSTFVPITSKSSASVLIVKEIFTEKTS